MKTRYKIAVLALVAVAGSAILGGSFWWKIFIRIACGSTLFVREEPVNTFAHVTKMIDAIECIISQMEVNE